MILNRKVHIVENHPLPTSWQGGEFTYSDIFLSLKLKT